MKPIILAILAAMPLCARAVPVQYYFESRPDAPLPMYGTFWAHDPDGDGQAVYWYPGDLTFDFDLFLPTISTYPDHGYMVNNIGTNLYYTFATNDLWGFVEGRYNTPAEERALRPDYELWGSWQVIPIFDVIVSPMGQSAIASPASAIPDLGPTAFLLVIGLGCVAVVYRRAGKPSILDRVTASLFRWM